MKPQSLVLTLMLGSLLFACKPTAYTVYPGLETEPVGSSGDAADDAAIFIHPTDMDKNAIIGTDKQLGLLVYNNKGEVVHEYPFGRINNVDLRQNIEWNGESITIVGGSNRTDNTLGFYRLNENTLELTPLQKEPVLSTVSEVYGFCLYRGDAMYAFVVGKDGVVEQYALKPEPDGDLLAERVRIFDVGSQCEGLVADDEQHVLFVGEETYGVWKYGARPDDGEDRELIVALSANKNIKADVEGITLYYGTKEDPKGFLIISSQGNHTYAVFQRLPPHDYLGSFKIEGQDNIDGTYDTDGIDVTHLPFSKAFPDGIFVAQDGDNGQETQNFKIVNWKAIEGRFNQ